MRGFMRKMSLVTTEERATFAEVEKGKNPVQYDGREKVFKKFLSAPGGHHETRGAARERKQSPVDFFLAWQKFGLTEGETLDILI